MVALLLERFPHPKHLLGPQGGSSRAGPIQPDAHERVQDVGLHLGLAGYDVSVDDLIRLLCHLCWKFRVDKAEEEWLSDLQLLRLVGAPGVGKSTLLRQVWQKIQPRLSKVETIDPVKWQHWQELGVGDLQRRLASWTPAPWVFQLDIARECWALRSRSIRASGNHKR